MDLNAIVEDQNPWWREPTRRTAGRFPVRRDLQGVLLEHVLDLEDRRATVVLGPRQVGKTTLVLQTADDLLDRGWPPHNLTYFDFSDDRILQPVTARQVVDAHPVGFDGEQPRALLLDEIHLAPSWPSWLKQAVDRGGGRDRIVVTDSAASLLREAGRESGQGRWDEHRLEGLSFREFARLMADEEESVEEAWRRTPNLLERYLATGGFPEHVAATDPQLVRRRLRSDIVERAILRDLAGHVDRVEPVRDLFVYLVQESGAIFSAQGASNVLGPDVRSVRRWISLLEDTFLLVSLPKHAQRASTGLKNPQPKIFAADHGLISAFSVLPMQEPALRAQAFEAVVFRHLRDVARKLGGELSYFRLRQDLEIDFVLETAEERLALEVTAARQLKAKKLNRLRNAHNALKADRSFLLHGALIEGEPEGLTALPLQRFLLDPLDSLTGNAR
jgi:hypothetical protein